MACATSASCFGRSCGRAAATAACVCCSCECEVGERVSAESLATAVAPAAAASCVPGRGLGMPAGTPCCDGSCCAGGEE